MGDNIRSVLFIAWGFPPMAGPTEYRCLRFVCHLAANGWKVDVLTVKHVKRLDYYDEKLINLIPSGVTVHRVSPGPLELFAVPGREKRRQILRERISAGLGEPRLSIRDYFRRVISTLHHAFIVPLRIPDLTSEWVLFAIWAAHHLLKIKSYDLVVSFSNPVSSHVVGFFIKKLYGLPWIGDFSDPFAFSTSSLRPSCRILIDKWIEWLWLSSLDAIIFPTDELGNSYLKWYPPLKSHKEKIHVIPYGFAEEQYKLVEPEYSEMFRLVYTGTFYPSIRNPVEFFLSLESLKNLPIEVLIAGSLAPEYQELIAKKRLQNMVRYIGFQPRERVVALQKGASALILLGNRGGVQLPGKIFDYFAAQRPIFMIQNDTYDIAAKMIQEKRRGLIVRNDRKSIADGIRFLFQLWIEGGINDEYCLDPLYDFSWDAQSHKFQLVLEKIMSKSKRVSQVHKSTS